MRLLLTIAATWVALSLPVALAVGRAMGRISRQIDAALSNYAVETPTDWLEVQPVDCLAPSEVDMRFYRIVGPLERERGAL